MKDLEQLRAETIKLADEGLAESDQVGKDLKKLKRDIAIRRIGVREMIKANERSVKELEERIKQKNDED
jgi:hypothetical protein